MSPAKEKTTTPNSALGRLGAFTARRPRLVIIIGIVLAVLFAALGSGTINRLVLSRFESPGSESLRTGETIAAEFDTGKPHFLLLVTAKNADVDDPSVANSGAALTSELARQPGVAGAESYWSRGGSPAMRGEDGRQAIIVGRLAGDVTQARTTLGTLSPKFTRDTAMLKVEVGGGDEVFRQAATQARADFIRAELIVVPLVLLLLFLLYRRFSAAALTLGMGLFSVVATLAILRILSYAIDLSTFAANLTLVMGIGLGVDYCLFVISRFREELRAGNSPAVAVERTVATAGRTVAFSGLTVAAALTTMLLFPFPFLQSFAYTGVAVVLSSLFASLFILPAALVKLGNRIDRRGATQRGGPGRWHRMATLMMARPFRYGVPALLVLLALGAPMLGLNIGLPDDRVLPESTSSRVTQEQIRNNFQQEEMDAVQVVTKTLPGTNDNIAQIDGYAAHLSRVPGVAQVDALTGSYIDGNRVLPPNASSDRFASPNGTWFSAIPSSSALNSDEDGLIERVRASAPSSFQVEIGGYPAELTDFRGALLDRVPLVFALILIVTAAILFLMTGSVLIPVKAIVLNILSMSVLFGVLVFVFQNGNLSNLLGFTAIGTMEPSIPILMFCVAFGLSMDYEVFMMTRIKEEYDRTGENTQAVAAGIERSGPLITAAALILAASFTTYATSGVVYLKMLGIGMALVILVDATLIRAVLVPVVMRLAGNANWWTPAALRRFHRRFGIAELGPRETEAGQADPAASAPSANAST
jgi:putative drug exporter of the RND superfamily